MDPDAVAPPLLGRPEALWAALQPALVAGPPGAGDGEEGVVVLARLLVFNAGPYNICILV